jgi:hypothetical protein
MKRFLLLVLVLFLCLPATAVAITITGTPHGETVAQWHWVRDTEGNDWCVEYSDMAALEKCQAGGAQVVVDGDQVGREIIVAKSIISVAEPGPMPFTGR